MGTFCITKLNMSTNVDCIMNYIHGLCIVIIIMYHIVAEAYYCSNPAINTHKERQVHVFGYKCNMFNNTKHDNSELL